MEKEIVQKLGERLEEIRKKKPLLHHITNYVVMNETANLTLALGALPVMAHAHEEVEEMVSLASCLVLNMGTLEPYWVESILKAGRKANELEIPIVFDPVGAGATQYRTETAKRILNEVKIDVLRGNAGEISTLIGAGGKVKGVESEEAAHNLEELVRNFAEGNQLTVAITGKKDFVTDGNKYAYIENGHQMLSWVTGTGCMATTLIGGFLAVEKNSFLACVYGLITFGICGELAAQGSEGKPGSFHVSLYDSLASLSKGEILKRAKVSIVG
jgi:hydroxyethylthiazole kinase